MKALIDGDILLYELGSCTDSEGNPLRWPLVQARLEGVIGKIVDKCGADDYTIYLTGDTNFRKEVATIKPYKGNRNLPKPFHYHKIKDYFQSSKKHDVRTSVGYEADDSMSMAQYHCVRTLGRLDDTVICSRDKDLKMVPGWHYSWASGKQKEKDPFLVDELTGWTWFFTQLLTGDPTDNIPGLYGVGKVKAERALDGLTDLPSLYSKVQHEYEVRFGSYWRLFMHENARLLWMLRSENDDIVNDLTMLEDIRKQQLKEDF